MGHTDACADHVLGGDFGLLRLPGMTAALRAVLRQRAPSWRQMRNGCCLNWNGFR